MAICGPAGLFCRLTLTFVPGKHFICISSQLPGRFSQKIFLTLKPGNKCAKLRRLWVAHPLFLSLVLERKGQSERHGVLKASLFNALCVTHLGLKQLQCKFSNPESWAKDGDDWS